MAQRLSLFLRRLSFWGFLLAATAGLASAAAAAAAGAATNIGNVVVEAPGLSAITVSVTGSTSELTALLTRAFGTHGGFVVAPAGEAQYSLRFDLSGDTVTVTAQPKTANGVKFSQAVTGANWRDAAYRAGDYVVEQLTHAPGFFAGKLAFVRQLSTGRELFASDLLGQEIIQLTNDHSESTNPRWSPDGSKLLYTGYYISGFPDIILLDLAARQRQRIAGHEGTNTGGVFSPDGRHIAMILSVSGNAELYVGDPAGRNLQRVTPTTRPDGVKASPTWSPDGTHLALSSDQRGSPQIYLTAATGGGLTPLALSGLSSYCAEPAWNPVKANLIAFMARDGDGYELALYDINTRKAEWLTRLPGTNSQPCWANDGRHIIFTHEAGGKDNLYIVDALPASLRLAGQLAGAPNVFGRVFPLTTLGAGDAAFVYLKK